MRLAGAPGLAAETPVAGCALGRRFNGAKNLSAGARKALGKWLAQSGLKKLKDGVKEEE